ncbi:MAG: hypothetical protein MJE77_16260 [Proteobacteria bacterium]|nr:hypothetical protein [Pseudomonadota bacterium]
MKTTTWQEISRGKLKADKKAKGDKDGKAMPSVKLHKVKRSHNWLYWQKNILHKFSVALHWFEVAVAALTVIFVFLGAAYVIGEISHFDTILHEMGLHAGFEELLSDILLLVVGIELAIMLVRRTPESLVEVMFFVIARKMLIKTGNVYELIVGVAALAGLFAIRKYLEHHPPARQRLHHQIQEKP